MTKQKPFIILYLYPEEMNFYGDSGNVLALKRRLEWRGFEATVKYHHVGDKLPKDVDIVIGGGGQDIGQLNIYSDLLKISSGLHSFAENNVPMLMVCGLYQLFGKRFVMSNKQSLPGIAIFDIETFATTQRMIGNIITETEFGKLVGFENHSGQTILSSKQQPFGKVISGFGNDETGTSEGAITKMVYGTYLHGAVLPKNPKFADHLIKQMFINRGEDRVSLAALDDKLTLKVHQDAYDR